MCDLLQAGISCKAGEAVLRAQANSSPRRAVSKIVYAGVKLYRICSASNAHLIRSVELVRSYHLMSGMSGGKPWMRNEKGI